MKEYRKWLVYSFLYTICFLVIVIGINYIVDPLQFYHRSFYEPQYSKQQRYQNPGLAKHYEYDRIILGSSMTENFLPSYVDEVLGGNTLKLSIEGSTLKEQSMIGEIALATGKVKNVLWGVDYFSLRAEANEVREDQGEFPFYLYDKNILNDWKYVVNLDTTLSSIGIIGTYVGIGELQKYNLDTLYNWSKNYTFGKEIVMKVWERYKNGVPIEVDPLEYERIKKNIDENIIRLVKSYPEVHFTLYYPPYTILQHRYYYERNPLLFQYELDSKQYIFTQIGHLKNVSIYDFQHLHEITFNMDHYKDLAHHTQEINQYIIDWIAQGEYKVNVDTINEYALLLKQQVETFEEEYLLPREVH